MRTTIGVLMVAALLTGCGNDPTGVTQETGTWTPVADGGTTTTYQFQHGTYIKTGQHVWANGEIWITTLGNGSATELSGLPFVSVADDEPSGVVSDFKNLNVTVSSLTVTVRPASRNIAFHAVYADPPNKGPNSFTLAPLQDGTRLFFTVEYMTSK